MKRKTSLSNTLHTTYERTNIYNGYFSPMFCIKQNEIQTKTLFIEEMKRFSVYKYKTKGIEKNALVLSPSKKLRDFTKA